ncbi:MAG TPA: hypothetical protein VF707_17190 [Ardenticatenaceae bacterium]
MPGYTIPRRLFAALAVSLLMVLVLIGTALAHEHREVGPYEFTVGWANEPALVNQPNGLDLRVARVADEGEAAEEEEEHTEGAGAEDAHEGAQPVEGLETSLQAEIIYGDQTMAMELRAVFGQPGAYTADVIPTVPGSYIFRVFGEVEGTQVDEQFNSADGEFSDVEALDALQFPQSANAQAEGALVASAQDVSNARLFGIAGLVVGALGLLLGLLALVRR